LKEHLTPRLLDRFVENTAEALPDAPAFVPDCDSLGKAWKQAGLRPGDLVLLCLPNGRELLHQFFGVLMAGAVPALLAPSTPVARLREIADTMGARAIGMLRNISAHFAAAEHCRIGVLHVAVLAATPDPAANPGEVVLLTSGTSGFASGCVFDFESILLNGQRHSASIGVRQDDTVLVNLPLYFSFALSAQVLASLVRGNKLVISGPPFQAAEFDRTIGAFGITIASLTPVIIYKLLCQEGGMHRSLTLPRIVSVGGDFLDPQLVRMLINARSGKEVYLTYGLTQAGPRVSTLAAHAAPESRYSSVGLPLEGTQVELRPTNDSTGLQQLFVTSSTVMKRTIGRIEGRTQNSLVAANTVATGDAFRMDSEGYLFFLGRLSDFISREGEKISLAAVRRVAAQIPHVTQAKTRVFTRDDGSDEYDLELFVAETALHNGVPFDASATLNRLLKRSEWPRNIDVKPAMAANQERYK